MQSLPWEIAGVPDAARLELPEQGFSFFEDWSQRMMKPHHYASFLWIVPLRYGSMMFDVDGHTVEVNSTRWLCVLPHTTVRLLSFTEDSDAVAVAIPGTTMAAAYATQQERPTLQQRFFTGGKIEIARGLGLQWTERSRPDGFERYLAQWLWAGYGQDMDFSSPAITIRQRLGEWGPAIYEFLEAHIDERPFPWDTLLEMLGTSRRTLQRLMMSRLGKSPSDVLTDMRLQLAMSLMRQPGSKLGAVARKCGFPSQSHFSTVFRTKTGLSPRKFRNRMSA